METILIRATVARKSWFQRLNPLWWFGNDDDPEPPDWYLPGKTVAVRRRHWYLRNPLHNFTRYVIGIRDRDHHVTGKAPAGTVLRRDRNETGWQWCFVWARLLPLPFISYSGLRWLFYFGWRPGGDFGIKFNIG